MGIFATLSIVSDNRWDYLRYYLWYSSNTSVGIYGMQTISWFYLAGKVLKDKMSVRIDPKHSDVSGNLPSDAESL